MEQSAITTVRIIQRKESQVFVFESEDSSGKGITIGLTMFKCIASTHGGLEKFTTARPWWLPQGAVCLQHAGREIIKEVSTDEVQQMYQILTDTVSAKKFLNACDSNLKGKERGEVILFEGIR